MCAIDLQSLVDEGPCQARAQRAIGLGVVMARQSLFFLFSVIQFHNVIVVKDVKGISATPLVRGIFHLSYIYMYIWIAV